MKMNAKNGLLTIALTLGLTSLLWGCGNETSETVAPVKYLSVSLESAQSINASAHDVGKRATAWQLARMDGQYDYVKTHHKQTKDTRNWIQGAFYIGLNRWAETVNDQIATDHIAAMAKANDYKLGKRPRHGDDHVIGQTYLWLYGKTGDKAIYGPTQMGFDAILADPPTNDLELLGKKDPNYKGSCQARWCWADALFMAPRTWLMLSNATGDPRYFEYADKEYWEVTDYLFSEELGLWYRDSRYFDRKSPNGTGVFWSRGNGWVFAGLAMIIEDLPKNHPSTQRYIDLYKKMAAGLMRTQKADGFYPPSLTDAEVVTTAETSGTGFITFGLAWGVNNGTLTDDASIEAVKKGWAAMVSAVDEDGMLHWVQQVGKSPDPVMEDDTQLYGVGALLLAASEMTKFNAITGTADAKPIAFARFVPERQDDFAWENDKVAFRVYGPAAPLKGHSSGVDNWFKSVSYPIINKWYAGFVNGISYHKNRGEGYDPYHTGVSRGTGSTGIWIDGVAYSAHNYLSYKILKSGGDELAFTLQYEWQTPLGLVGESKMISLAMGDQLFTVNSVFTLNGKPASLPIAVGVTTHDEKAKVSFNKSTGRISAWEIMDDLGVGTGALVDPSIITGIKHLPSKKKDVSHIWIFTNSDAKGKLTYRAGFGWEGAGEITTTQQWNDYLDALAK